MANWRNQHMVKTHCKQGHEFSPDNTYHYQSYQTGGKRRVCKTCAKKFSAEQYQRKLAN
jgi:hypothetical protein